MPEPPTDDVYPGNSARRTRFQRARDDFLLDKSKGEDSGTYRRNAEREINRFRDWHTDEHNELSTFDAIDGRTMRQYARHLTRQNWTDGTVLTYYAQVSAFIGWCKREGLVHEHYAQLPTATEPLPEDDGRRSGDQQAWGTKEREQIIHHVNEEANAAVDALEDGAGTWDAVKALRDRALVAVLCYSGNRAGEILARTDDVRRNGITWGDVELDEGGVTVLSKKQKWDDRSLPEQTIHPLRMLKRVLDPQDDWAVFVTLSPRDVFPPAREALADAGLDDEEIDDRISTDTVWEVYREHDLTPAPLQTGGARKVMDRLTDAAGIDLEQGEYLEPHGGRRGAGEVMVRTHGYAAAARLLDNTEEMVRERYSHIEAGELADAASKAFEAVDNSSEQRDDEIPETYR
jgi:integrase